MIVKHVWFLCREKPISPARGGKLSQPSTLVAHLAERPTTNDRDAWTLARCSNEVQIVSLASPIAGGAMLACVACLGLSETPVSK